MEGLQTWLQTTNNSRQQPEVRRLKWPWRTRRQRSAAANGFDGHSDASGGRKRQIRKLHTALRTAAAVVDRCLRRSNWWHVHKLGQKSSIHIYIYIIPEMYKLADCRQTCLQTSETSLSGCIQQRTLTSHKICYREDLVDRRPTCLPLTSDIQNTDVINK